MAKDLTVRPLSSLAKVFPEKIFGKKENSFEIGSGQELSFQVAFKRNLVSIKHRLKYKVEVISPLFDLIKVYTVKNVPCMFPAYPMRMDDNYLKATTGMYPDVLIPLPDDSKVYGQQMIWQSLWITVTLPKDFKSGKYPVTVRFYSENGEELMGEAKVQVNVHKIDLPKQTLMFTQWFHCDCIADIHNVKIFSEKHWELIEKYMDLAAKHGMNMILTPLLTPPLDTAVGTERPTVQLVDIVKDGDKYSFDFSRLERFIAIAHKVGIYDFEMNPLFTQWGAEFAPKVMAKVNGRVKRIFGWDTPAVGKEYVNFLNQLIPSAISFMNSKDVSDSHIFFHVSDEPNKEHLPAYLSAMNVLLPLISTCRRIDTIGDYGFYTEHPVEFPVIGTNYIEPFLEHKVENLWCYYCCAQCVDVANKFLSMPSSRNRIIGIQMYLYNIVGFLHWGYNFYYNQFSLGKIDPYAVTDAGGGFPSGDAFCVYPYGDGVTPSLRMKVFSSALEDMRLLKLVENKIGREKVVEAIEKIAGMKITFTQYPHSDEFFKELYNFIFDTLDA